MYNINLALIIYTANIFTYYVGQIVLPRHRAGEGKVRFGDLTDTATPAVTLCHQGRDFHSADHSWTDNSMLKIAVVIQWPY